MISLRSEIKTLYKMQFHITDVNIPILYVCVSYTKISVSIQTTKEHVVDLCKNS